MIIATFLRGLAVCLSRINFYLFEGEDAFHGAAVFGDFVFFGADYAVVGEGVQNITFGLHSFVDLLE